MTHFEIFVSDLIATATDDVVITGTVTYDWTTWTPAFKDATVWLEDGSGTRRPAPSEWLEVLSDEEAIDRVWEYTEDFEPPTVHGEVV